MNIRPVGNRLVLLQKEKENKTVSGIILSNNRYEDENYAVIDAIGAGVKDEALQLGQKVIFNKHMVTKIEDGDLNYLIINEEDILAIVEEDQ